MDNLSKSRNTLKKYSSYILLATLIAIVSLITYYRVLIQFEMGPVSDTCDFLSNALVFAGQDMGYSDLIRPPFFSFLLSIIFRTGYLSINAAFILDGLMYIFGVVGLFFLLKLRFNSLGSFLGALLFATFPIVLVVMGVGFSDLASVSITIWTFYFLILAVQKNSKYFYFAFPFAMLAFLTRYNSALIIFPIFLYILINKSKINVKDMFAGIFTSFLFLVPVFIFFFEKFGNILYPFMNFFGTTSGPSLSESAAYDPNLFFFIDKFPLFIGTEGILAIFIILMGIFIYGLLEFKKNSTNKLNLSTKFKIENRNTKLKLGLFIVLISILVVSFGQVHWIASEILFFVSIYIFYTLIKELNIKNIDTYLLIFTWLMAFLIFQSLFLTKDNRYFVIMAPPVAYFIILGLNEISNRLNFKVKNKNITFPLITIILTAVILLSAASYLPVIKQTNEDNTILNENMVLTSQWLTNYDPDYKNKVIYSDFWPNFAWYLKTNVKMMSVFKDGQSYSGGVKDFNLTPQDNIAYNKELDNNNAYYYLCVRKGLNLTHYTAVKQFGNVTIYKRK